MLSKTLQIFRCIRYLRPDEFRERADELRGRVVGALGVEEDGVCKLADCVPEG